MLEVGLVSLLGLVVGIRVSLASVRVRIRVILEYTNVKLW